MGDEDDEGEGYMRTLSVSIYLRTHVIGYACPLLQLLPCTPAQRTVYSFNSINYLPFALHATFAGRSFSASDVDFLVRSGT